MIKYPHLTHLIGANTYDQLSTATLFELFYWLDFYGIDYVIDQFPPPEWGVRRRFKSYKNVLTIRYRNKAAHAFTRVMSKGNPLRGMEISSYWLDETRDTPEDTHDVVLSRCREPGDDSLIEGLVTSTTNGEDWAYDRFYRKRDGNLFGCCHVPTYAAVRLGILTDGYYQTLKASYSEMMALQELEAQHVNVKGGRAYYAAGPRNRRIRAPWGDYKPNPQRPLIVGMDFNFTPSPCVWMVGQRGPTHYNDRIHWFGEIKMVEASIDSMMNKLCSQYPGFFLQIYGDASGKRGTTSNAGKHDYRQIQEYLQRNHIGYTISVDQSNPLVRDRVENMNAMFHNSLGQRRQTYDPQGCPLFDADMRMVGWTKTSGTSTAKLSTESDPELTHASDAAGYAVWKIFPPAGKARLVGGIGSARLAEVDII